MDLIQRAIELRWPVLLFELIFLIGGILLIVSGRKIRKQSKISFLLNMIIGLVIALVSIYTLYWTIMLGYNS